MSQKLFKILEIAALCFCVALIVLACLFFIPHKTTPIDLTLEMEIYPGSSIIEGTVPITLNGTWEQYLLNDDHLMLTIDDFEHYYNIHPLNSLGDPPYLPLSDKDNGYQSVCFVASSTITGEDSVLLFVKFKNDLSGWVIQPVPNFGIVSEELQNDPSFKYAYAFNWLPWEY